jgi:hypothetical protein
MREVGPEGALTDEAMITATQSVFDGPGHCFVKEGPRTRALALAKARGLLKRTDIQERLSTIFESAGDFDVVEAVEIHVKHIRGEIEKQVLRPDGEVVTVREKPSLSALLAYERMTLPQPASKVAATVVHVSGDESGLKDNIHPMVPRALNASVER